MLSVLTQLVKNIQDQVFVVIVRISWIKDFQENLLNEDNSLLLQVLSEVKE